jgi:hypothetical protein
MRYLRFLAFFVVAAVFIASAADSPQVLLRRVKTIYIARLEGQNKPVTDMLQAKLIAAVSKVQGIAVLEDEENADAILTGSGLLETGATEYGHTRVRIQAGMRLVSKDGEVVLWADNIASSRFARSASSSFAENVAKSLERVFVDRERK